MIIFLDFKINFPVECDAVAMLDAFSTLTLIGWVAGRASGL